MSEKYFPPKYQESAFHCPYCQVKAHQHWDPIFRQTWRLNQFQKLEDFECSECIHCKKIAYWYKQKLIIPDNSISEPPHLDLPLECKSDYDEAASVLQKSPRSAAALLRLCIQKLLKELGEKGKKIDDDIASLVKKGLPKEVQEALDICRVTGNNAVHPGEMNIKDSSEIVNQLFRMINFIVEDRITRPKQIHSIYQSLPQKDLNAINNRDNQKSVT